jgi:tetratricopeptide (TPR) repeat protein
MSIRRWWTKALYALFVLTLAPTLAAQVWLARAAEQEGLAPGFTTGPVERHKALRPNKPKAPPSSDDREDRSDLVIGTAPDPALRSKMLGELYDRLGKAQDAQAAEPISESIEQLWRLSGSDTVDLLRSHAETFIKETDLDLAMQVLDAVVELAPEDAEGWHQRALLNFTRKDYQHALADLRRALAIDPNHYKALNGLGVVLEAMGDKKGALEAYRKALRVNPFLDSAHQSVDELSRAVEGQDI